MFQENLDNALCRTTIPTLGNSTLLPPSGDHVFEGTTEQVGIFADKDIASHLYRLNMFRITVQRNTGHAVEGSFLGYVPGIGYDTSCMGRKTGKIKIAKRFDNMKIVQIDIFLQSKSQDDLYGRIAQRSDDGQPGGRLRQHTEHLLKILLVGQQSLAVQREDKVASLLQRQARQCLNIRKPHLLNAFTVIADVINEDVPHHIYL